MQQLASEKVMILNCVFENPDFRALKNIVIVREEKEPTGFYFPNFKDPSREALKVRTGTVIAAGHGLLSASGNRLPMDVKAGDRVVYDRFVPGPDDTHVMREDVVIAVVDKDVKFWEGLRGGF